MAPTYRFLKAEFESYENILEMHTLYFQQHTTFM
jgi:hypothetical protein